MGLTEILVRAQEQRKASDEALKDKDFYAGVQHGVTYWALRNRADKFKVPPGVTPAGTPVGARQVPFIDTNVVATRKVA
jgi:hypothetical protein